MGYKCKNNNDCDNDYLCCASCEKFDECVKDECICQHLEDGENIEEQAKQCTYVKVE